VVPNPSEEITMSTVILNNPCDFTVLASVTIKASEQHVIANASITCPTGPLVSISYSLTNGVSTPTISMDPYSITESGLIQESLELAAQIVGAFSNASTLLVEENITTRPEVVAKFAVYVGDWSHLVVIK
jgi:hypothetical protein